MQSETMTNTKPNMEGEHNLDPIGERQSQRLGTSNWALSKWPNEEIIFWDLNYLASNKDEYIDPDLELTQIENSRFKSGPKNEKKYKNA